MNVRPTVSRARVIALTAAGLSAVPWVARTQTLQKIRVAGVPTDDMTPIFYALKTNAYSRAGLDVEVVPTSSGTVATESVVAGAYELGKGSLVASLVAHLRGLPLTIVGNGAIWDQKNAFSLALVAADSPIKTAADLNAKTCSTAGLNDLNQLALMVWMDKNGGDSSTVKWVEIPNSAAGAALVEHRIDACSLNEPQLAAAVESGKARVLAPVYSAMAEHFAFTVYFAQPAWAAQHADAIKKFLRVTYDTAGYTNTHHAETAALMADVTKIPLATIQKMARVSGATSSDPRLIQPAIDAAAKYKYITRSFPAKEAYFSA